MGSRAVHGHINALTTLQRVTYLAYGALMKLSAGFPCQGETQTRRALLLYQVEEIARSALDGFSVTQPVELQQYLEQFLGQSRVSHLQRTFDHM